MRTAAQLADLFIGNDTVLEFLHEQSTLILERLQPRNPHMTLELFRKIMGGTVADA